MKLMLAEDEPGLSRALTAILQHNDYEVDATLDGLTALEYLLANDYDAAILDIMMPGMDGIEVLKRTRAAGKRLPIIMLTAKSEVSDKVEGLDAGADDYLPKPFGMMEMVSRIKAVLRRAAPKQVRVLTCGGLSLDGNKHTVTVNGRNVALTLKEFELLKLLMESPGTVFTREVLLSSVWGVDFAGETRTVDVHIGTLRTKLAEAGELIRTVRGVGYKLEEAYEQ